MTPPEVYLVRQPMANPFVHGAHQRHTSDSVVLSWTLGAFTGIGECARNDGRVYDLNVRR